MPNWGHWKNPVLYMSRATTREVWQLLYGTEPDLTGDLRYGKSQIPVLFDDRLDLGVARLEEAPEPQPTGQPAEDGSTVRLTLTTYGTTTVEVDRAEYIAAKEAGQVDEYLDSLLSDVETRDTVMEPDGRSYDPHEQPHGPADDGRVC